MPASSGPSPIQTNFAFLREDFPDLYRRALEAERRVFFDPRAACVEARITLEISTAICCLPTLVNGSFDLA